MNWPLLDANISDQLPKLYLFDSLNRTMCGGDMSPYSVSGAYAQKVGVWYPLQKVGVRVPPRKLRLWTNLSAICLTQAPQIRWFSSDIARSIYFLTYYLLTYF